MFKVFLFVLILTSISIIYSADRICDSKMFVEKPSDVSVSDFHYDPRLKLIVLKIRASFFLFSVDQYYGIKVKDSVGAKQKIDDVIGKSPIIVELH